LLTPPNGGGVVPYTISDQYGNQIPNGTQTTQGAAGVYGTNNQNLTTSFTANLPAPTVAAVAGNYTDSINVSVNLL
jgi:hypothetical protein